MNNSRPAVSVIVPVYNVKDYLEECLDSISKQSLTDIEVIIVDDGSDDGSESICDRYSDSLEQFKVIHQENKGLSDARNAGIELSTGRFLMFIDSDDTVVPDFCRVSYDSILSSGSDIVVFGFDRIDADSQTIATEKGLSYRSDLGTLTRVEAMKHLARGEIKDFAWNKIYTREVFDGIRFPSGESWEDMAISYLLFDRTASVTVIPDVLYHYRRRPNSLMLKDDISSHILVDGRRNAEYEYMKEHCPEAAETMKYVAAKLDMKCCAIYAVSHPDFFLIARDRLMEKKININDLGFKFWFKTLIIKFAQSVFIRIRAFKTTVLNR